MDAGIVQTLLASQQLTTTNEQRVAATRLFEQLKAGEVHASAAVATELLKAHQPPELQVLGYTLLQHLVGNRWEEFSAEEHSQLGTLAYNMLQQGTPGRLPAVLPSSATAACPLWRNLLGVCAASWAIRSKASLLLALVIKRTGHELWEAALPQLLQAAASEGPAMQEQVCMVLRYVADEITLYSDDIAGDAKRLLLSSLTKSLGEVLPFLERMLELNFGAAGAAAQAGNREAAQQHVLVIQAALQAANTYSEWVPVGRLKDAGLIAACGYMLSTTEFREAACDVMRQVAGRRQSDEAPEVFKAVLEQAELGYEGQHDEFGQTLCETMATLGTYQLSAIASPDKKLAFLQHMLSFAQHPYLLLADKALPMWVKLLQDAAQSVSNAAAAAASAAGSGGAGGGGGASSPRQATVALPPECILALMDMAADQLQKRGAHVPTEDDEFPSYFDTFADYKEMMVQYRVKVEEARGLLESAVHFAESAFKAVWDGSIQEQPAKLQAVVGAMEPMLQRLLSLQVRDAILMQHQARGLETFHRLFGVRPDLAGPAVGRVFDLLVNNLPLDAAGQEPPPAKPPPGWRDGMHARQYTAMVLLVWTKASPQAFLPHLEALATQVGELWEQGRIRAGEKNALQEAIVGAARAGPEQLQASVLEWVLAPVRGEWATPAWQAHLASPQAFMLHYTPVVPDGAGGWQVGGRSERWILYHHAHLAERCIRSMKAAAGAVTHPLAQHAEWAVPNMLRIVACLHALYTPAGRAAMGPAATALEMAPQERALYLRRGPAGKPAVRPADAPDGETWDDGYSSVGGASPAALRAWLRHMREFTYQSMGLLPTHCPPAMDSAAIQAAYVQSAFAYIESLEHQHVRIIMRHILIPHIKNCADRHLRPWVLPALAILVPHMHSRLTSAWGSLQAPAGPSSTEDSASANDEIIRERLLRELTQEYALLLKELTTRTVGGPGPGSGAPGASGSPPGAAPGGGGTGGGKAALEWLLEADPGTGFGAVTTAVAGMCWRDDSAHRFALLARSLVGMAPRDARLYAYVGSEVLKAAITSLGTETMATHQADVMQLIRDILAQQINDPGSAVHGVLASLPKMTPADLDRFRSSLLATGSEKAQRDLTKKMLVAACGKGSLAALADWKPPTVASMTEPKLRAVKAAGGAAEEHAEAFTAAAVSTLFDR
ncbi:hypothetical protein CHLNCDRAFT_139890 [Chlorella variabilis]|uniref:Uncharacterized protein n=1 Tax=Chlorella variabilis TaxID=554065 RepID=E1ZR51_CHLVA|nr:hypothetical protein CHLNCDRAFT_139890 [Chlorella variabilis]EFN51722.1 hypothetical protein CHLNCDRAFT_139890 [Chlorella variabilis]|eukprot:XP_005843824.1 hypothetical protein CHLNCDRAFT_139890 [Chlorella variabilis]